ncbi:MAG: rhodanese-like domain-containing protein [Actinomycetota bacterium]
MPIPEVSVAELESALAAGARLVDVRETDEYVSGHVSGAIHIALGTVPDAVDVFRGEGTTYVICRSGARSMKACEFLALQGVDVANVVGGTMQWIETGRSVVMGSMPA